MDDFLAYLADTVESHFIKNTDLNGTVLGTILLTAYKETNQQIINLPLELSCHEPDLPSCEISRSIYVLIW